MNSYSPITTKPFPEEIIRNRTAPGLFNNPEQLPYGTFNGGETRDTFLGIAIPKRFGTPYGGRNPERFRYLPPDANDPKEAARYGIDLINRLAFRGNYAGNYEDIASQFGQQYTDYSKSQDVSNNLLELANRPELSSMASGKLTQAEEEAYNAALSSIDQGRGNAEKRIEDTVRSESTSRGLFSSRGAIANEASGIAELDKYAGSQKAALLQGRAALSREGVNTGTSLLSGLYGQAAQAQQSRQGVLSNILTGVGQAYGSATEQNKYLASLYQSIPNITYGVPQPPQKGFLSSIF